MIHLKNYKLTCSLRLLFFFYFSLIKFNKKKNKLLQDMKTTHTVEKNIACINIIIITIIHTIVYHSNSVISVLSLKYILSSNKYYH
jgi:hypothetical protein